MICCGTIYKGPNDELLIDPRYLKPCKARLASLSINKDKLSNSVLKTTTDINSDSSSDSGYDENSIENSIQFNKKDEYLKSNQQLILNN